MRRRQHHLFRTTTAWERNAPATLNFSTRIPQAEMPIPHFLSTLFRANPQPRAWSEPPPVEHSTLSIFFFLPCIQCIPWLKIFSSSVPTRLIRGSKKSSASQSPHLKAEPSAFFLSPSFLFF